MTPFAKVPPHDVEIEKAVLGALLLEGHRLKDVHSILKHHKAFYGPENQIIYIAMLSVHEKGLNVDMLTVMDELTKKDELSTVGGAWFLAQLTEDVVNASHITTHATILFEKYLHRELIKITTTVQQEAYKGEKPPFELLGDAYKALNLVSVQNTTSSWTSAKIAANAFLQYRDETIHNGNAGLTTTIPKLDAANGGFRGGQFILVAARPGVGKSAYALGVLLENAAAGKTCGIINLEMSTVETVARGISQQSGISHATIERDSSLPAERLMAEVQRFSNLPVFFSDTAQVNIRDITAKATKLKETHGLDLLVVDYLQLVSSTNSKQVRQEQVSEISRGLKLLAMTLQIPVIALSQLNRESENRGNKRPAMSDLRESGSLEQDADVVILLHSDWKAGIAQDAEGNSTEGQADMLVAKWRNGGNWDIKLRFDGPTMKFTQADLPQEVFTANAGIAGRQFTPPNFDDNPF